MKNIFLIPTDQPTRLCIDNSCNELNYSEKEGLNSKHITNQCMYITSDEEIKKGDNFLDLTDNTLWRNHGPSSMSKTLFPECKKIILTTDTTLIVDGVQAIDDEFLEWFIKNPSCESVEVESMINMVQFTPREFIYKIIIPKEESKPLDNLDERFKRDMSMIVMPLDNKNIPEEPKQKFSRKWKELKDAKPSEPLKSWDDESEEEALEKAATNYSHDWHTITGLDSDDVSPFGASIVDFKAGAKWQAERMYSEEEIEHLIHLAVFQSHCGVKDRVKIPNSNECAGFVNKWFEQFKKK